MWQVTSSAYYHSLIKYIGGYNLDKEVHFTKLPIFSLSKIAYNMAL